MTADGAAPTASEQPVNRRRRWLRWLGFVALPGLFVMVMLSFHQPPNAADVGAFGLSDSGSALFAANPVLRGENRIELFYATNRLAVGPRNDRIHAIAPWRDLLPGVTSIRIGDVGTAWDRVYEWSWGEDGGSRPPLLLEPMIEMAALGEDVPVPAAAGPAGARLEPGLRALLWWLRALRGASAAQAKPTRPTSEVAVAMKKQGCAARELLQG